MPGRGVDTRDLSSKTIEERNVSGLCIIGEAVDVTGWLGGYNFSERGRPAGAPDSLSSAVSCPA